MNNSIIDSMLRHGVGMNPYFFENAKTNSKYPPHNITQIGDNYRLTLAVAGFTKDELEITVQEELLIVSGKKLNVSDTTDFNIQEVSYLAGTSDTRPPPETKKGVEPIVHYNGIAFRNFESRFMIGDVEVKSAVLSHGLLDIDLIRHIPEAKKPKRISILSSNA